MKTGIVNMILTVTKQDSNHKGEHSEPAAEDADVSSTTWPDRLAAKEARGVVCSQSAVLRRTHHRSQGATVQIYRQHSSKVSRLPKNRGTRQIEGN